MFHHRYSSSFGFIDLLFNLLVGFVFLFFIAYILINPVARQGIITPPDKLIITAEWTKASIADIDLWMMDPTGAILSFQNKVLPGSHLEKDDLGATNDTVWINGEKVVNPVNSETIHVQTLQPGTYYISVHLYNDRQEKGPHTTKVKIRTIDPYRTIIEKEVTFEKFGQEIGIVSFKVNDVDSIYDVKSYSGGMVTGELSSRYSSPPNTRAP